MTEKPWYTRGVNDSRASKTTRVGWRHMIGLLVGVLLGGSFIALSPTSVESAASLVVTPQGEAPNVVQFAKVNAVTIPVAEEINRTPDWVSEHILVRQLPGSAVVEVRATAADPNQSIDLANSFAFHLTKQSNAEQGPRLSAEVTSVAMTASPSRGPYEAGAVVIGFALLGILSAHLLVRLSARLRKAQRVD